MSRLARAPHDGIAARGPDGEDVLLATSGAAGCGKAPQFAGPQRQMSLADTVGVSSSVRPGRGRNRVKTELDDKVKKPADSVRKKSPPARKAPARGRYVDEYARPAV